LSCILWAKGASAMIVRETAALARCFSYFHFVDAVGMKWGRKRSDRIYPAEKWPGRPSAVTLLSRSGRSRASKVEDLNFRIRFISRRPDLLGSEKRGHRKRRRCVVNAGTKCRRDGQAVCAIVDPLFTSRA